MRTVSLGPLCSSAAPGRGPRPCVGGPPQPERPHAAGSSSPARAYTQRWVGPQLAGALVFIFVTNAFYGYLARQLPGVDTTASAFRLEVNPLNTPPDARLAAVVRDASTSAFHLAMALAAFLLLLGALVCAVAIRHVQVAAPAQARPSRDALPSGAPAGAD